MDDETLDDMVRQEVQLQDELTSVLRRFASEYTMTTVQIVGVLDLVKAEVRSILTSIPYMEDNEDNTPPSEELEDNEPPF